MNGPENEQNILGDPPVGQPVKSAERTIIILELLARSEGSLTASHIAKATSVPKSSLHWLLQTLLARHWIEQDRTDGGYRIGPAALLCGTAYLDRDPIMEFVPACLEEIRHETGFTTHYARLDTSSVIYLATSTQPGRLASRVGRKLPAMFTALGKSILADHTADEMLQHVGPGPYEQLTPHSVSGFDALTVEVEEVRRLGYAVEREQNSLGLTCVATVVPYRIPCTDAISVSMPSDVATDEMIEQVGTRLIAGAEKLAQTLRAAGIR